nr:hypothetical protein [Tanacetum cinerariifolium]
MSLLQEALNACAALARQVEHLEYDKVAQALEITKMKRRKRKGVVIRDPKEESTTIRPTKTKSKDKGKRIIIEEPKLMKRKQQVKINEEYARKLHAELNKDID